MGGRKTWDRECLGVERSNRTGTGAEWGGGDPSFEANKHRWWWVVEEAGRPRERGLETGCPGKVMDPVMTPRANPIREKIPRESVEGEPSMEKPGESRMGSDRCSVSPHPVRQRGRTRVSHRAQGRRE